MHNWKILRKFVHPVALFLPGIVLFLCCAVPVAYAAQRPVYLTFDDGPSFVYTPQILDILHQEHVPATFFVLGRRAQEFPATMVRIRREGHEIGNHGFYHTSLVHKSQEWIRSDVQKADMAINAACGVKPYYFRPPGGLLNKQDGQLVQNMGHSIALWSLDTEDWKAPNPESIIRIIKQRVHPGSIILMHDGVSNSKYTVKALPEIIHFLKSNHYTIQILPIQFRGNTTK